MGTKIIERQFGNITKGVDEGILFSVCRCLVLRDQKAVLGYESRVDLPTADGSEELSARLESWVYGRVLDLRVEDKIAYIGKRVQAGQENSVK